MRMMDIVEVVVEKKEYTDEGVHKGMQGVVWQEECIHGEWEVCFPQYGEKPDIAEISIKEEDLRQIPSMDARVNERIRAQFE